jgi:hypothetical protein
MATSSPAHGSDGVFGRNSDCVPLTKTDENPEAQPLLDRMTEPSEVISQYTTGYTNYGFVWYSERTD